MKVLQLFSAVTMSLVTVACATPPPISLAFGPQSNTALLVSASPRTAMATTIELRRVNMETLQFEDEIVSVENAGIGGNQINRQSNIWLSLKEIDGGDYALVSLATNTFTGYSSGQAWRCLYSGAPVFKLPSGQISIVQLGAYWGGSPTGLSARNDEESVLTQEFESARARYPRIAGQAVVVAPHAIIRWEERRGIRLTRNCSEPSSFEVLARKHE
ncbi:hypothetical protein [Sphingosinithalassobacter portus]|uniref:hypothetical protein n=1 Tax=Stakelama portus TaxID=2676234 RepID=UPI0011AB7EE9|nr:hypothetical protein [Sphingosinithalassobacter portus]